ncbi:MAG: hypothetical protein JW963_21315 [Anaerolineales bacterium]|nr:hypothetical protein [Anaerolineales bacterium]
MPDKPDKQQEEQGDPLSQPVEPESASPVLDEVTEKLPATPPRLRDVTQRGQWRGAKSKRKPDETP